MAQAWYEKIHPTVKTKTVKPKLCTCGLHLAEYGKLCGSCERRRTNYLSKKEGST